MVIIITQKRNHKKTIHRKVIENSEFKKYNRSIASLTISIKKNYTYIQKSLKSLNLRNIECSVNTLSIMDCMCDLCSSSPYNKADHCSGEM